MKDLEKLLKLSLLKNKFTYSFLPKIVTMEKMVMIRINEPNTSLKDGMKILVKKYSDEDVDKLISKKFAEWEKETSKRRSQNSKRLKIKNMTEQEKAILNSKTTARKKLVK